MRGFTVACVCLVIIPLVLAYPWGEGNALPYKRDFGNGLNKDQFEYELTLPKRNQEFDEAENELINAMPDKMEVAKKFLYSPFGYGPLRKRVDNHDESADHVGEDVSEDVPEISDSQDAVSDLQDIPVISDAEDHPKSSVPQNIPVINDQEQTPLLDDQQDIPIIPNVPELPDDDIPAPSEEKDLPRPNMIGGGINGDERYDSDALNGDQDELDVFNTMQRRNGWCGNWGDFCRPDAKMKYAQCCPGMRCMCGHFWTNGKCQCKSKGTFGR